MRRGAQRRHVDLGVVAHTHVQSGHAVLDVDDVAGAQRGQQPLGDLS